MRRIQKLLASFAVAMGAITFSGGAASEVVGLRVLAQPWNPATNDDRMLRLVDDPQLISAALSSEWRSHAPAGVALLTQLMGAPDLIAKGVTLYDIKLSVPEPVLAVQPATLGAAPGTVTVSLHFEGVAVVASATQPTAAGAWADPRCSARFNLDVSARIIVGVDLHHPLATDMSVANGDKPVTLSAFSWQGENTVCDIGKGVVQLAGWDNLITHAVESAPNGKSVRGELIAALRSALEMANGRTSAVPAGLVRTRAWVTGRPGQHLVTLYFGLAAQAPDVGPRMTLHGTFTNTVTTPPYARVYGCSDLHFQVQRITGPRPVLNADGVLGPWPTAPVSATIQCAAVPPHGTSPATISGLPPFPLVFTSTFGPLGPCSGGLSPSRSALAAGTPGWPAERNDAIAPIDFAQRFDLAAVLISNVPCGAPQVLILTTPRPIGPMEQPNWIRKINPAVAPTTVMAPAEQLQRNH